MCHVYEGNRAHEAMRLASSPDNSVQQQVLSCGTTVNNGYVLIKCGLMRADGQMMLK